MEIIYKILTQNKEIWGIDIIIQFTDIDLDIVRIFKFKNQNEIDKDFKTRMNKAITNIIDSLTEKDKPSDAELITKVEDYFKENNSISKENFEELKNTGVITRIKK